MITVNDDLFNSKQDLYVARTLIDEASALVTKIRDESIIKDIKEIKNKIFDQMRTSSNNLFTFAKAFPLVVKDDNGEIQSWEEFTRSKYELLPKILRNFE